MCTKLAEYTIVHIFSKHLSPRQKKSILKLTEMVPKEELDTRLQIMEQKQNSIVVRNLYKHIMTVIREIPFLLQ